MSTMIPVISRNCRIAITVMSHNCCSTITVISHNAVAWSLSHHIIATAQSLSFHIIAVAQSLSYHIIAVAWSLSYDWTAVSRPGLNWCAAAWKVIKTWLSAEAIAKIKFATRSDVNTYIDVDQLLEHMGGTVSSNTAQLDEPLHWHGLLFEHIGKVRG